MAAGHAPDAGGRRVGGPPDPCVARAAARRPRRSRSRRACRGAPSASGAAPGRLRRGARRRKRRPRPSRQDGQRPGGRRNARPAAGVQPAGPLARLAGQGVTGGPARAQAPGEPVRRARIKMAETDLHARSMQENGCLYKYGSLKGCGPWPARRRGVQDGDGAPAVILAMPGRRRRCGIRGRTAAAQGRSSRPRSRNSASDPSSGSCRGPRKQGASRCRAAAGRWSGPSRGCRDAGARRRTSSGCWQARGLPAPDPPGAGAHAAHPKRPTDKAAARTPRTAAPLLNILVLRFSKCVYQDRLHLGRGECQQY